MDEAQQAPLHPHLSTQESLAMNASFGLECTDLLPVPIESHDYPHQVAHCDLPPYPSQQTLRNYFSEQCGRLGTLITNFDSLTCITIATRIVRLFKRISKSIIESLHSTTFLDKAAALLARMKNGWKKQGATHRSQLEVSNNRVQANQSWCKSLKELICVGHVLYGRKDERIREKGDESKVTGQSAHTFIIETSLDLLPLPDHQLIKKFNPLKRTNEKGNVSWSELITVTLLSRVGTQIFTVENDCEYMYLTQKDIHQYKQKNEPLPTEAEYKRMMEQFQEQSQEYSRLRIKCYLIMDIIDEFLVPDCQRFCEEIKLKWTHYTWNGEKLNEILSLMQDLNDGFKKEEKNEPPQPEIAKTEQKEERGKESCSRFAKCLVEYLDTIISDSTCVSSQDIHTIRPLQKVCSNLEQASKTSLVKKEEAKKPIASSAKTETPYEETERKIKDTQKRMDQLLCWKELMVECKFRCRLGYKCPCGYNIRQLDMEERYMNRLLRYRNLLLPPPPPPPPPTAEPQRLALTAAATIECYNPTPITTDKPSINSQPMHSQAKRKMVLEPKDHKQRRVKYDYISRKVAKKDSKPQIRLRRGHQDYSEQELNLLNLLNQMELEDTYRAPCYVEEERVGSWKKMGDRYRKETANKASPGSR